MRLKNIIGEYLSYPKLLWKLQKANRGIRVNRHKYGNGKNQYTLYFSPEKHSKETTIIYIHGGGWRQGSPTAFKCIGKRFADLGYNTVLLGYRHAPRNKYPVQAEDIFSGLAAYIKSQKNSGINVSNIVVIGSSAGAHLGAVLVYDRDLQDKYGISQAIFRGFISLGGPLVFEECKNRTITALLNGLFSKEFNRELGEPYNLLNGDEGISVLCLHAERDPFCEPNNSIRFVDRVNDYQSGLAQCYIEKDKRMFHSNLAAGILLYNNSSSGLLYSWIEGLSTKHAYKK